MIVPSIDIMQGRAVQLVGGKEKALESDRDPIELAKDFQKYGDVAVIDLDAALGKGDNSKLIKKICSIADCRVGGGIRTIEKAQEYLRAGAKKIIIGTNATREFLEKLPKDRIIVAVDAKNGKVVTEGWEKSTKSTPQDKIKELENYCSGFLFTNVNVEGRMEGFDKEIISKLGKTKNLTLAGGITTIEDLQYLSLRGLDAQIGMSIYTGKLNLDEALVSIIDFEKCNGLVPTIVQEETGQVLMLAYSNKESLKKALESSKGTYYSRSREEIWSKGNTSGNSQELLKVRYDCDRDTLLFVVRQKNGACHKGSYSCFGGKEFVLEDLYNVLKSRLKEKNSKSYTAKLGTDDTLLRRKILEEANEVVNYENRENLVWEIADLTYFVMVLIAREGISPREIVNELGGRRK